MAVIDHTNVWWTRKQRKFGSNRHNGAKYYSMEIVEKIIPKIKTDRNWVTVNVKGQCYDHSIVFVHSNLRPDHYEWLKDYDDLVLVCSQPETCKALEHIGKTILLPLSIDRKHVSQFKQLSRKGTAFVGRIAKAHYEGVELPEGIDYLCGMPRDQLLVAMARYENVYAVGRCAMEAMELGCNVLPYDPRYPDPSIWKPRDTGEVIPMLQRELDKIDGGAKPRILCHTEPDYIKARNKLGAGGKYNGAYYYSKEIVERMIPLIDTDRNWITLNFKDPKFALDHSIVIVHNHKDCPWCYQWLKDADDLIFVCSEVEDMPKLEQLGEQNGKRWMPILLKLSIDVEYVKQFRCEKTKEVAFVGRKERQEGFKFPEGTDFICNMPREKLLAEMAKYRKVYCSDRCALEALVLGCEVLKYETKLWRTHDPEYWEVMDNTEAAMILQHKLDCYDKEGIWTPNKE